MKFLQLSLSSSGKPGGRGGPAGGETAGCLVGGECSGVYSSCKTDLESTQGEVAEKDWKKSNIVWKEGMVVTVVTVLSLDTNSTRYLMASSLLTISVYLGKVGGRSL